jgi:hypothetical protein
MSSATLTFQQASAASPTPTTPSQTKQIWKSHTSTKYDFYLLNFDGASEFVRLWNYTGQLPASTPGFAELAQFSSKAAATKATKALKGTLQGAKVTVSTAGGVTTRITEFPSIGDIPVRIDATKASVNGRIMAIVNCLGTDKDAVVTCAGSLLTAQVAQSASLK